VVPPVPTTPQAIRVEAGLDASPRMSPMSIEKPDAHMDNAWRTRAKVCIRAIAFFYHLSLSILFTTFTELLLKYFDNHYAKTAAFLGLCAGVERGMQFVTSPVLGNLSDSMGRKSILLSSLIVHAISLGLVVVQPGVDSVLAYFVVNGACNVTLTMCNAIVTDLTVDRGEGSLAQQYGRMGVAIGISLIIGPAVGPLLSKTDVLFPIFAALGALVLAIVLGMAMPETLATSSKRLFVLRDLDPIFKLRASFRLPQFSLFSVPFFLTSLAECVYQFMVLYTKVHFNWSFVLLGLYVAGLGLAVALVQGSIKHIVPRFLSERMCVIIGLLAHTGAMVVIGVATEVILPSSSP
jgi:MFS transporter, DHA1 family, tetracycline resistance protein